MKRKMKKRKKPTEEDAKLSLTALLYIEKDNEKQKKKNRQTSMW